MNKHGFTLVELSMVLVIIGLIVGGTMAGRELVYAAKIRQTITQKASFDTAVGAFKAKYECYPGDCKNVASMGLPGIDGNEDGIVYTHGGWGQPGEYSFWRQLAATQLIPGGAWVTNTALDGNGGALPGYNTPTCPICKLHDVGGGYQGAGWFFSNLDALTSLNCSSPTFTTTSQGVPPPNWKAWAITTSSLAAWASGTVTVADAAALDKKVDDGRPVSGEVVTVSYNYYSDAGCSGNFENPAFNLDAGIFYLGDRGVYNVGNSPGVAVSDIIWKANF